MKQLLWVLFYGLVIFLSLNRHSRSARFTYHSEISGDKAGYYVYLPAAFVYHFDARAFPDSVDKATNDGFHLNQATGKVETKYSYGVALLEFPFWLVARGLTTDTSGFSKAEHKAINVASATYFVLGLWLLSTALRRQFTSAATWLTVTTLVLGTNLWYYGIIETGMSHVYSFFAFALLLYLLTRRQAPAWYEPRASLGLVAAIAATVALISVLRPLNAVLALPLLLWPVKAEQWRQQLRGIFQVRMVGLLLVAGVVLWLPQLAYYHYLHGSWLAYSYGQEGFPNLLTPKLAELWAAPKNGSFLYNPVLLLLLPGTLVLFRTAPRQAALAFGTWAVASYLYAAWWDYALGCGYAGRGFVELYVLLAWPIAALMTYLLARPPRWVQGAAATFVVVCLVYNMRLSLQFDRCFYGTHAWDWSAYYTLLLN